MSVQLFVVATPIGNLDDITLRAIKVLEQVELVAAEDTRHSKRLLNHLGIRAELVSLHEHNEHQRIDLILQRLAGGQSVALISDAGTPLISDPGYPLVRAVIDAGYRVTPIPGASSIVTALCAAGLPTDRFCFHGFLPQKNQQRLAMLEQIGKIAGTQVLLESTHRIERLLQQLVEIWPGVSLVLAKELTKSHERFIRGAPADCLDTLQAEPGLQKGEFVVLLHHEQPQIPVGGEEDTDRLIALLLGELPVKKVAGLVAHYTGDKKNKLYQRALQLKQDD
jgi:16S rRNA (cytidine1402-2'-O)-methyltransferase